MWFYYAKHKNLQNSTVWHIEDLWCASNLLFLIVGGRDINIHFMKTLLFLKLCKYIGTCFCASDLFDIVEKEKQSKTKRLVTEDGWQMACCVNNTLCLRNIKYYSNVTLNCMLNCFICSFKNITNLLCS